MAGSKTLLCRHGLNYYLISMSTLSGESADRRRGICVKAMDATVRRCNVKGSVWVTARFDRELERWGSGSLFFWYSLQFSCHQRFCSFGFATWSLRRKCLEQVPKNSFVACLRGGVSGGVFLISDYWKKSQTFFGQTWNFFESNLGFLLLFFWFLGSFSGTLTVIGTKWQSHNRDWGSRGNRGFLSWSHLKKSQPRSRFRKSQTLYLFPW